MDISKQILKTDKKQILDFFSIFQYLPPSLSPRNAICIYLGRAGLTRVIYVNNWHVLLDINVFSRDI